MTGEAVKKRIQRQATLRTGEDENTDLIQKACRDPDAFAKLYLMYYAEVFGYCVRRLFDRQAAEDVTSTVFFKVMHHLNSFEGGLTDFRNWLLRIATNAVNDYLRDTKRRTELMEKSVMTARGESVLADNHEDTLLVKKALLKEALLSLKPKYQTVITLHFFKNMKLTEIAACLGKKPSTVRSWLFRATERLRQKLNAAIDSRELEQ